MARTFMISGPGYEKDLEAGLRVPVGDTVTLGNITLTKSSNVFNVQNLAVNVAAIEIDGVTYGPGQGVVFDLEVTGTITTPSLEHLDIAYETTGGIIRTDRLYIEVRDAVEIAVSPTMASRLGQSDVTDNLLAAVGIDPDENDLGTFTGTTIADGSSCKTALQAVETKLDDTRTKLDLRDDIIVSGADPTGTNDSWSAIQAAIDAQQASKQLLNVTTGSSIYVPLVQRVVLPKGIYSISQPLVVSVHGTHLYGPGAVIKPTSTFYANAPNGYAVEFGEQTTNSAIIESKIDGLSFVDFRRIMRAGQARNNINLGRTILRDVRFIGRDNYPSLGVRIFNRSADFVFEHCYFDNLDTWVECQSSDQVSLVDCRGQVYAHHEWAALTVYAAGDVVFADDGGTWKLFERIAGGTSRASFDATEKALWTFQRTASPYEGFIKVRRGRVFVERQIANPPLTMSTRTTKRAWCLAADFEAWEANARYIEGDIVAKAYDTGGNSDVYWARKTGQDGYAGASWDATERAKWLVAEAPSWGTGVVYAVNDVVRVNVAGGTTYNKIYRCTSAHTAGTFATDLATKWAELENVGDAAEIYPFSVWCSASISRSLLGAENGGWPAYIWAIKPREEMQGKQNDNLRYFHTECRLQDCVAQSDRAYSDHNLRAAVVLAEHPNTLVVENNQWNDVKQVAVAYVSGVTKTRPAAATNNRISATYNVVVRGNAGGTAGTVDNGEGSGTYQDYGPNYVPPSYLAGSFVTVSADGGIPVWVVESEYMVAKNPATTPSNTGAQVWAFLVANNLKRFVVYFETGNQTLNHSANFINLKSATNVKPAAGSVMVFEVFNNTVYETWRSF